jgi:hypothetical protein
MKVKELMSLLRQYPQNTEILLSEDAEGNGFFPVMLVDCTRHTRYVIIWPSDIPVDEQEVFNP